MSNELELPNSVEQRFYTIFNEIATINRKLDQLIERVNDLEYLEDEVAELKASSE